MRAPGAIGNFRYRQPPGDYEDINDAERLAEDPTFRMLASRERSEGEGLPFSGHLREVDARNEGVGGPEGHRERRASRLPGYRQRNGSGDTVSQRS
jgi:hypothetical protein